ncbi:MAG: RHS repeat-associated core domain-containing protein, partial [Anaerolineae bacterium]
DASGNKVGELRYLPYGETRTIWGITRTDRRFTGQIEDAAIDLYFYNARYYAPALGRFIQADTIVPSPANPQTLNRYSYVLNSPLRYIDPTGHYSEEEIMQAFGVSTWEEVLALFLQGSGTLLENRWGWLEVLRKAQDGDLIFPTPWDVDGIRDLYAGAYKIQRDSEGKIFVGDFDHAYFANHQTQYTLISERLSMPFTTPYSKIHWHADYEIFDYSWADAEAIGLDVLSIIVEAAGASTGWGAVIAEPLQIYLDAVGHYGASQACNKIFLNPKQYATIATDDWLAIASEIPVAGMVVDVADIVAHALGARVVWTP